MRYISEDGKVFNTEQECLEHENNERRRIENERIKREMLEKERQNRLNVINQKYKELQKLVYEYGDDYEVEHEIYFTPFYELARMLG